MKDPTVIHSLAARNKKSGKITFIRKADGQTHYFYSVINSLTGTRLSGFDSDAPYLDSELAWVQSVFKNIKAKEQVIECIGDF